MGSGKPAGHIILSSLENRNQKVVLIVEGLIYTKTKPTTI
jgi:hypothetical protein